mmetsp:Transcript_31234/g.68411  ORF Transcript_31234/g.68411 Transcript_31234/m.68411 type:complete len:249 (-) Transcript_31234:107-853(-)
MPPRRPGGKYKGMIARAKGEATLAAEAAQKAAKHQEELLKRMHEKRQREIMAGHGLSSKDEENEAKMQRVLNMFMGGKKGNAKKFFRCWTIGVMMVKKDRLVSTRALAWRRSCGCFNSTMPCGCNSSSMLQPTAYALPFDLARSSRGFVDGSAVDPLRSMLESRGSMLESTWASGGRPSGSPKSAMRRSTSSPLLPSVTKAVPPPPEPFLNGATEVVSHSATGRRCLLDRSQMRMVFADLGPGLGTVM